MEWLQRMNKALDYIESNLSGDISYDEAARVALCSSYHFQRMFSFITNVPLAEYVRRRRLTLAAQELQNPDVKVIDIALKYGYDSPDAFARAFQKLHGMTPSAAREPGVLLKAYPRISFYLTLKGDKEMEYKIIEKEGFKLFGKSIRITLVDGACYKQIPQYWEESYQNGIIGNLREAAGYGSEDQFGAKALGAALFDYKPDGSFSYMITAMPPEGGIPEEYEVLDVPKMTWAVITKSCMINENLDIMSIWHGLADWFEATGYEHAEAPELEEYKRIDINSVGDGGLVGEVWIPIIKK